MRLSGFVQNLPNYPNAMQTTVSVSARRLGNSATSGRFNFRTKNVKKYRPAGWENFNRGIWDLT